MNRRVCVCVGLFLGCVIATNLAPLGVAPADVALAQSLPPGVSGQAIPLAAKNAPDAASANAYSSQIRKFIQDEIAQLKSADFVGQAAAKTRLVDECSRGSQLPFYAVYAREWSTAALPLLSTSAGNAMRLRLNIAIITARLSEICQSMDMEPVIRQLLNDHDGSVALWGIKAARPLIIITIQTPRAPAVVSSKLISTLVDSVKNHGASDLSGFITTDAYHVLVVREIPGLQDAQVKVLVPPLVPPVLNVLEFRIAQYAGPTPLTTPGAERDVATFLSTGFATASRTDQARIVKDLVYLETYAGQRANLYTTKAELGQLREMLKYTTSALKVIANNAGVDSALNWLSSIPPAAPVADIENHTKQVWGTMQNVFKDLPKPPEIPVAEPPPPPPAPTTPGVAPAAAQ